MTAPTPKTLRCAVYTRVSTDAGLEQDFNSLHAQREACEAYIKSQTHEGWRLIKARFDDGGFSGGNMERPALQALLAEIRERRLDIVVVYKVDRLTRSLADFAKLVELFDAHGVSFVSVIDGDTFDIARVRIRLEGIDAPEADQICLTRTAAEWSCGIASKTSLADMIHKIPVSCIPTGQDRFGRTLARCRANGVDLNAWLVRSGWALSFTRYGDRYKAEENDAKENERGLWSGAFIAPWDWRHRNHQTEILGTSQVPVDAQKKLMHP